MTEKENSAQKKLVEILKQGPEAWNEWRDKHTSIPIDLSNVNLGNINLTDLYDDNIEFSGTNLSGVNLSRANLKKAILGKTNFSNADLRGTNLESAYLEGANLKGANLTMADLRGANLVSASIGEANLLPKSFKRRFKHLTLLQDHIFTHLLDYISINRAFTIFHSEKFGANLVHQPPPNCTKSY